MSLPALDRGEATPTIPPSITIRDPTADDAVPRSGTLPRRRTSVESNKNQRTPTDTLLPEHQYPSYPQPNGTSAAVGASPSVVVEPHGQDRGAIPDAGSRANTESRYEGRAHLPSTPAGEDANTDCASEISALPDDAKHLHEYATRQNSSTTGNNVPNNSGPSGTSNVPEFGPDRSDYQKVPGVGTIAQTTQLTGWPAVEKALTEFDRQEIAAYKEDLDSLLTFTGLYSAVLTAFVIVSYPQLQEDTAGETLQVLRLIAAQTATYTILDGRIANATAVTPLTSPSFQPSASAIRVNILWFASLVISLAVASLSILVKQWLRAYMAFASASPLGQLRIRHFRRSGMETWKVFEIASILPLLLQVSLALFFVGLCIFTFGVHPAIGNTTLPLVCAWAFLLVVVTIFPVFSARCPYKTPALSTAISLLRSRVYPVILTALTKHTPYAVTHALSMMSVRFTKIAEQLDTGTPVTPPIQEVDKLKDGEWDLQILASADALQADDNLLGTTMLEALQQSSPDWVSVTEFLVRVIGNRVPLPGSNDPRKQPPPASLHQFHSLPSAVRSAIARIFRFHVIPGLVNEMALSPNSFGDGTSHTMKRWSACIFAEINRNGAQFLLCILGDRYWDLAAMADVLLADDHLFVTTVTEVLKQRDRQLDWASITEFLIRVIGNRIPLAGSNDPRGHTAVYLQQYHLLPSTVKATIAGIFRRYIIPGLFKQQVSNPDWRRDAALWRMSGWVASIFDAIYDRWSPFFEHVRNVSRDGRLDLAVLASADALLADDDFLAMTVIQLLQQSDWELGWVPITVFLVRVIGHRVPLAGSQNPWEQMPPTCIEQYHSLPDPVRTAIATIFKLHVVPRLFKPQPDWTCDTELRVMAGWSACIFAHAYDPVRRSELLVDVLQEEQWDLAVLARMDTLLADDSLLAATVIEVLKHDGGNIDWASATEFLVRTIGSRIPWLGSDDPRSNTASPMQRYGSLPEPVRTSVFKIFGSYVIPGLLEQQISNPVWADDIAMHIISGWSACIFDQIYDSETLVRFFTPHRLFYRWLVELAHTPWWTSNVLAFTPTPQDLQPSIDLVKVLMWCETGQNPDLRIVNTILSVATNHEGRLKPLNAHLVSEVAQVLLPLLDVSSHSGHGWNTFNDPNFYAGGVVLTIKLHDYLDDWSSTHHAGVRFSRHCLQHLILLERAVDRTLTQLRNGRCIPTSSSSGGLIQALRLEQQSALARMKKIFLSSLDLGPPSIYRFSHLVNSMCQNDYSRTFTATVIANILASTPNLNRSRIHVLNLSLLAIGLVDFETARANPESSSRVISRWRLAFNLLAYALFRTSSADFDVESEVFLRICRALPQCADGVKHRRSRCTGDASFIPDYFCLSLSSIANERPLILPLYHCRPVFLSNMLYDEKDVVCTTAEREIQQAMQEMIAEDSSLVREGLGMGTDVI